MSHKAETSDRNVTGLSDYEKLICSRIFLTLVNVVQVLQIRLINQEKTKICKLETYSQLLPWQKERGAPPLI